jgi:hypothetical protein
MRSGVKRGTQLWVPESPTWWQRGVFYQIYPRSFRDASGDGLGDLRGILERVDYLAWLGVDAIWSKRVRSGPTREAMRGKSWSPSSQLGQAPAGNTAS